MENFIPFAKMNGIGNQIIVADMRARHDHITPEAAIALAADENTRFDQLMAVHSAASDSALDARIEIFNCDGTLAEACGNGTRCVVQWLHNQTGQKDFSFEVLKKPLKAVLHDLQSISVDMGMPRFNWDQIPLSEEFNDTRGIELQIGPLDEPIVHTPSVANIGNPHAVFWVDRDVYSYALDKFGPMLENHMLFPERANISLAQVLDQDHIIMRTWERGAGLTQACGSAACAVGVSAARLEKTGRHVTVQQPGGTLNIEWRQDNHIIMTGAAEHEFNGQMNPLTGEWVALA